MAVCRQRLGLASATIGFLGSIIACGFPAWKVTKGFAAHVATDYITWQGLWMFCLKHSTSQRDCKVFPWLYPHHDLQAIRVLVIISIVFGFVGILLSIVGGKCTNCVRDEKHKSKVTVASGIVFIAGSVLLLIPVCWVANNITADFYTPFLPAAQRREFGMSLYIGWASAGLLLLGGGLLCCSCPPKDETECEVKYSKAHSKTYMSKA